MHELAPHARPAKLFYSYSHRDAELRDKLDRHLAMLRRDGDLEPWYDRKILPGSAWGKEIAAELEQADIILLLISADFIASDYCMGVEMKCALDRHKDGDAVVVPVILREVDWSTARFRELQALPRGGIAVTTWANEDAAFADVARGIRELLGSRSSRVGTNRPQPGWEERAYVARIRACAQDLQRQRTFIEPSASKAVPLSAARLSHSGRVSPGLPSERFRVEAQKLSAAELRRKYCGAELDYEDYLSFVSSTKRSDQVTDVAAYIAGMRERWAIQLLGAPGIGKSFIFREACAAFADGHAQTAIVPFLIELRDLPDGELKHADQILAFLVAQVAKLMNLVPSDVSPPLSAILAQGRAVVFFDAIDELGEPVRSLQAIDAFKRKYPDNRFVFSCRTFDQVPGLVAEELLLLPLSQRSLAEYFRRTLAGNPCMPDAIAATRNPSMRRLLGTPLVASAYARYIHDHGKLPASLLATLLDSLRQRFVAAAVKHEFLDAAATKEEVDRLYQPVSAILRALAHEMRHRLTASRSQLESIVAGQEQQHVPPIEWVRWSGVLYETAEGDVAFALHRYKELYLAQSWAAEHATTGHWPAELPDMLGRLVWNDALTLFSEVLTDKRDFVQFVSLFCEEKHARFEQLDMYERYQFVEGLAFYGRIAARMVPDDGTSEPDQTDLETYYHALFWVHWFALQPGIRPGERSRFIRSLASHATVEAADVMLAIFDDADCVEDELGREVVQETALIGLAEMFLADDLDVTRAQAFVRRTRSAKLSEKVRELLNESRLGWQIRIWQFCTTALMFIALGVGWSSFAVGFMVVVTRGAPAIALASGLLVALLTVASLLLQRFSRPSRPLPSSAHDPATQRRQRGIPYDRSRYWLENGVNSYTSRITRADRWASALWVLSKFFAVIAAGALVFAGGQALLSTSAFRSRMAWLDLSALYGVLSMLGKTVGIVILVLCCAALPGAIVFQYYRSWRSNREWNARLRRVQQEGRRLRSAGLDITDAVDHLMDDIDTPNDLGRLQARIEAIRSRLVVDDAMLERLHSYAQKAENAAIAKLLWSVIEDLTRTRVMHEERQRYQQ